MARGGVINSGGRCGARNKNATPTIVARASMVMLQVIVLASACNRQVAVGIYDFVGIRKIILMRVIARIRTYITELAK